MIENKMKSCQAEYILCGLAFVMGVVLIAEHFITLTNEKPKSHFTWFVGDNRCYATDFKKFSPEGK